MSATSTWASVKKGDRVELKGQPYTVAKIKPSGKRAAVKLLGAAGLFKGEVKLKDAVKLAPARRGKRQDNDGGEWYKPSKKERKAADFAERNAQQIKAGDPSLTKPPRKPSGDPWETRRDKVEAKLDKLLGAVLVGEASDEAQGYYVPPVDASTVAAHWMIFHEGDDWQEHGEAELLKRHDAAHHDALHGNEPLKVNHWHTETRPKASKK